MIYLLGLCYFIKLSNICHRDLLKVLKHAIRTEQANKYDIEKQKQTSVRITYKT